MKKEYSISDYFSIIGRIITGILRSWKIITLTLLIGAAIGWGISYFEKSYYSANTDFFLDDSGKNSGLMGFASLAQQIMVNGLLVQCKNLHCGPRTKNHPQSGILN